jgi:uncharacterized protein YjdB
MGNETPLDIILENDPQQLIFSGADADEITLTITNSDTRNAESVLVNIVRADLLNKSDLSLSAEQLAGAGYQMIDDTWFECREAAPDAWEPIDDWATPYDVGALAAGASASFEVRINRPTLAADAGRICFAIMISSKPADIPAVTGISIDQSSAYAIISATTTLTATVTGAVGYDDTVAWTSSDAAVATIGAATGIASGVGIGRARITATSVANPVKRSAVFIDIFDASPVAGMSAWYDFSDTGTITDVAGEVSSVTDKSGNGYTLTKSAIGPLTGSASLNTLNVLSFLGNNYLTATGPLAAGTGNYTAFIVWGSAIGAPSPSDYIFFSGTTAPDGGIGASIYNATGTDYVLHTLGDTGTGNTATISDDTQPMLLQTSYDGAEMAIRITNQSYFDVTATKSYSSKNTANNVLVLGANDSGASNITGVIAEVLLYNSTLTSAQIAQNRAYLLGKWGL